MELNRSKYPTSEDIVEMRRRGYDSATIAEATRRCNRASQARKVMEIIEAAFTGVRLGSGIGLRQAREIDDGADGSALAKYRADDEKNDWRLISIGNLCNFNDTLTFMDAEGFRFHLPAFLIAELRGDFGYGIEFSLTSLDEQSKSKFQVLSDEQKHAVKVFLLHILDDPDFESSRESILYALKEYWDNL